MLGRGSESLDLLSGAIKPWSRDRCSLQYSKFVCSRFSMVTYLIGQPGASERRLAGSAAFSTVKSGMAP